MSKIKKAMIQDIIKDNEAVSPVSRELKGLREYFPQCFDKEGHFDIEKFREAIEPKGRGRLPPRNLTALDSIQRCCSP